MAAAVAVVVMAVLVEAVAVEAARAVAVAEAARVVAVARAAPDPHAMIVQQDSLTARQDAGPSFLSHGR